MAKERDNQYTRLYHRILNLTSYKIEKEIKNLEINQDTNKIDESIKKFNRKNTKIVNYNGKIIIGVCIGIILLSGIYFFYRK